MNGKDITKSTLNPRDLVRSNAADIDINAAQVPPKDKKRRPKKKGVLVPCDNKRCNKQSSHGAAFCMFYTGAKESETSFGKLRCCSCIPCRWLFVPRQDEEMSDFCPCAGA